MSATELEKEDIPMVREMKQAVRSDFAKRYTEEHVKDFLLVCTRLDPRFRALSHIGDDERQVVYEHMAQECVKAEQRQLLQVQPEAEPEASTSSASDVQSAQKAQVKYHISMRMLNISYKLK